MTIDADFHRLKNHTNGEASQTTSCFSKLQPFCNPCSETLDTGFTVISHSTKTQRQMVWQADGLASNDSGISVTFLLGFDLTANDVCSQACSILEAPRSRAWLRRPSYKTAAFCLPSKLNLSGKRGEIARAYFAVLTNSEVKVLAKLIDFLCTALSNFFKTSSTVAGPFSGITPSAVNVSLLISSASMYICLFDT